MSGVSVPPPASRNVGRLKAVYEIHRERLRAHREGRIEGLPPVPCGECNACCTLPAPLRPDEVPHRDLMVEERDGLRMLVRREDGSCIHLVDGRCTVYEHRPITCRTYDCRPFFAFGVDNPGVLPMHRAFDQWFTRATADEDEALVLALAGALAQGEQSGRDLDDLATEIAAGVANDLDATVERARRDLAADPGLRRQVRDLIASRLSKKRKKGRR